MIIAQYDHQLSERFLTYSKSIKALIIYVV